MAGRLLPDDGSLLSINFMLNADEVAFILDHSGALGVIAEDGLEQVMTAAIGARSMKLKGWISLAGSGAPDGWEDVAVWERHPDASAPDVLVGDDRVIGSGVDDHHLVAASTP